MPFVVANALVNDSDVARHKLGDAFVPAATASQLKAMMPELEWKTAGELTSVQYAELAPQHKAAWQPQRALEHDAQQEEGDKHGETVDQVEARLLVACSGEEVAAADKWASRFEQKDRHLIAAQ